MVGCVLNQLKPSELYIVSCGNGLGLQPFQQLRIYSSSGFILYVTYNALNVSCACMSCESGISNIMKLRIFKIININRSIKN